MDIKSAKAIIDNELQQLNKIGEEIFDDGSDSGDVEAYAAFMSSKRIIESAECRLISLEIDGISRDEMKSMWAAASKGMIDFHLLPEVQENRLRRYIVLLNKAIEEQCAPDIGAKIKSACAVAGISLGELAARIGTSKSAFSQRLQTGKFSVPELEKIAGALGADYVYKFTFPDGTEV